MSTYIVWSVFMSVKDLQTWMATNNKTAVDIASGTKLDPMTIRRYLQGKNSNKSTVEAIRKYIIDQSCGAVTDTETQTK